MRGNQEGGTGILTEGFDGRLDDGDELAAMDSKTQRRQPACAVPGAANNGTFVIPSGPFYRWGNGEPRGRGGLMVVAGGGELLQWFHS
jgi:hypothetical protein